MRVDVYFAAMWTLLRASSNYHTKIVMKNEQCRHEAWDHKDVQGTSCCLNL